MMLADVRERWPGLYLFWFEFIPGMIGVITGAVLLVATIVYALYWVFDRPECYDRGRLMGHEVTWSGSTGCMVNIRGQWLPYKDVAPVERDGKVVFVPRPVGVVKVEK